MKKYGKVYKKQVDFTTFGMFIDEVIAGKRIFLDQAGDRIYFLDGELTVKGGSFSTIYTAFNQGKIVEKIIN